jgi:hypothetical protein
LPYLPSALYSSANGPRSPMKREGKPLTVIRYHDKIQSGLKLDEDSHLTR